jgi:hypothetical protein
MSCIRQQSKRKNCICKNCIEKLITAKPTPLRLSFSSGTDKKGDIKMPQNRESGVRANEYGRETAKKIAEKIGARSISKTSNEFDLRGRKITIRCARHSTSDFGVTYKMLERIDAIFAAPEQEDGRYKLYEMSPSTFKKNMRETCSRGPAAGKVGLVRKAVFIKKGKSICSVKI